MLVTVVIPVYRDAGVLARMLEVTAFGDAEVVVAGAEGDPSLSGLRAARPDLVWVTAPRGRARQMNAGAAIAHGDWLLFLHADTQLPREWWRVVERANRDPRVSHGCFRFALDSSTLAARVIEIGVRMRVRIFALPYGDQALFVRREVFTGLEGFSDVPIMEDVDFVIRLRETGRMLRGIRRGRDLSAAVGRGRLAAANRPPLEPDRPVFRRGAPRTARIIDLC